MFRFPCCVWMESQKRWVHCQLYVFETKLNVTLVNVAGSVPDTPSVYVGVDLCMLLDVRLSYTWSGYRSLVLSTNKPGSGSSSVCWTGVGARDCTSGGELWLSSLKSVHSTMNAIQLYRRYSLSQYCQRLSASGPGSASAAAADADQATTERITASASPTASASACESSAKYTERRSQPSAVPEVTFGGLSSRGQQIARIAELVDDSEAVLGQSAAELESQGQSLRTSHGTLKSINTHLQVASKLVDQVSSYFPAIWTASLTAKGRSLYAHSAVTRCVIYSPPDDERMYPGTMGVYTTNTSDMTANVVLQGESEPLVDDAAARITPVSNFQASITITSKKTGKQQSYTVWAPRMCDIFKYTTTQRPAATSTGVFMGTLPSDPGPQPKVIGNPLDGVSDSLHRMKAMALHVGDELQEQNGLLDEMYDDATKANDVVCAVTRKAKAAV